MWVVSSLDLEMPALVLAERMDLGTAWDGGEGSMSIFTIAEVEAVGVLRFFFAAIVSVEVFEEG